MKTIRISLTVLFICMCHLLYAQTLFQKSYGGNKYDYNGNVIQTNDGGYLFSGWTQSYGFGINDIYLIKTTANGDTMWSKTFGTNQIELCRMSLQLSSGAYVLTGYKATSGQWDEEAILIKIDVNGNILWQKTFGGTYNERGRSVAQTTDGGFIIGGISSSYIPSGQGPYLVKTDSNGNLSWANSYGPGNNGLETQTIAKQTIDGGYAILNTLHDGMNGYSDFRLIKTTANGAVSWSKGYNIFLDEAESFIQTPDSGYLMLGSTLSAQGAYYDVLLIKTDVNGDVLWAKTYGGAENDGGVALIATQDGGYVMACGATINNGYTGVMYLIKINASGNIIWTSRYGDIADFRITSVCQTADHGFMIGGASVGPNANQHDIVAIKTDSLGKSLCNMTDTGVVVSNVQVQVWNPTVITYPGGVEGTANLNTAAGCTVADMCMSIGINDEVAKRKIDFYPNPFSSHLNINYTSSEGEVILFDFSGKEVLRQKTAVGNTTVQTSDLIPGLYILSYHEKGHRSYFKVLKY